MNLFLTREETERVTGYKSKRHQKLWLKSRRISFTENAAVRLSQAGCTAQEVAAITGHKIHTSSRILDTYIPRNIEVAKSAIRKLEKQKKVGNFSDPIREAIYG